MVKPGYCWPGADLLVIFRAISEQPAIILAKIILLKVELEGIILDC